MRNQHDYLPAKRIPRRTLLRRTGLFSTRTIDYVCTSNMIAGHEDQYMHFDQLTSPVLKYTDDGALLLDIWAGGNEDWVATTIFVLSGDHLELREARTFGRWRGMGLVHLMTSVAQNLTGWTKQTCGHRWVGVW